MTSIATQLALDSAHFNTSCIQVCHSTCPIIWNTLNMTCWLLRSKQSIVHPWKTLVFLRWFKSPSNLSSDNQQFCDGTQPLTSLRHPVLRECMNSQHSNPHLNSEHQHQHVLKDTTTHTGIDFIRDEPLYSHSTTSIIDHDDGEVILCKFWLVECIAAVLCWTASISCLIAAACCHPEMALAVQERGMDEAFIKPPVLIHWISLFTCNGWDVPLPCSHPIWS